MAEEVFTISILMMQWDVCGTNQSKGNKIKDFESFGTMFFFYSNKQNAGVFGWPF